MQDHTWFGNYLVSKIATRKIMHIEGIFDEYCIAVMAAIGCVDRGMGCMVYYTACHRGQERVEHYLDNTMKIIMPI